MIPLLLDLRDREVCIFGAGRVALRKARLFSNYARVRVVSDSFHPEFEDLSVRKVRARVVDPEEYIGNAFIIVPATDDREVNSRIMKTAHRLGRLVDSVDGVGDIIVPSILKKGDIVIAISTSGKSPGLSRHLRRKLEESIGPAWESMVRLQSHLRALLKARLGEQTEREGILRRCLEDERVWKALEEGDEKEAWSLAAEIAGLETRGDGVQHEK
ncbi:MAG: bifunctional precorrin-2 dehydrogenase/sirohydrochlorin ferrochelatase [Thermoplasmata archaeon]